jgi:hypothetical protein
MLTNRKEKNYLSVIIRGEWGRGKESEDDYSRYFSPGAV